MSENTQIVQDAYTKFGEGDVDGLLEIFSEEISWTTPDFNGAPFTGTRHGHGSVREFFGLLDENEDFKSFEPGEFIAAGDKVVVLGSSLATIKSTGRDFETDWVHIFTVKDGKVTSFLEFFDTAAAERAYQKSATA